MSFLGLRAALSAMILLAIAPALLLALRTYSEQNELVQDGAHREARRLVQLASLDQDRVLEGTQQLLIALAQLPEVRTAGWSECTVLFGALLDHYEGYTNLGVADSNGDVRCAAIPNPEPVNISDRAYFQRAVARRTFAVGDYQIGRTTKQPNLGSGFPVLDSTGRVQAVVWASRDLSWLNQHVAAGELPSGANVMMFDAAGTILAYYPNPDEWVGQTMADTPLVKAILQQGQGTALLPGLDGKQRLHAFSLLRAAGGSAHVTVGLSEDLLVAETNRLLTRNLLGIVGAALFALLLAGVSGEVFFMRRVRRLAHAADRLRAGDLRARAGGPGVHDELAQVAIAFDSMAEALAERTENLSAANEKLQVELAERERSVEERARLVSELEARGEELEARFRELALLHEIGQSMLQASDLETFLQASLDRIMPIGPYDLGVIRVLETSGQGIEWFVSRGYRDPNNVPGVRMTSRDPSERATPFRSLSFRQATAIPDLSTVEGYRSFKAEGAVSLVAVPIRTPDGLVGTFIAGTRAARVFSESDVQLLDAIGSQLGVAAQKARLYEEMRRSEEQLRQAQKMEAVGVLAGGIAHDFNNLLTAIMGFSELLLADPAAEKRRAFVEEIMKAGQRATSLTSQLLAFSRQQLLRPEVLDLNRIVTEMDRLLGRLIGEDIDVVTIRESGLGKVWADPGQIAQVLLNLAANARDAMPTGGVLTIETANVQVDENDTHAPVGLAAGSYVGLSVRDTGHGMDAPTRARIFEPFFTTKEQGKGTGLGLSTVYGIVKQSGGDLRVESELGRGTVLTVYLPRYAGEPGQAEESAPAPAELLRGAETVLLVEDEDGVRRLAREVLATAGYAVLEASNGPEALQVVADHKGPIHLLMTDVVMPVMSGREVAEQISVLRPDTRVLYMSGYTPDVAIRHGVLEASVAYLQKPFAPSALTRKVRETLDSEPVLATA